MIITCYENLALIILTVLCGDGLMSSNKVLPYTWSVVVTTQDHVRFTDATPSKRDQRDQNQLCIRAPPLLSSGLMPGLFKKSRGGLNIRMSNRCYVSDATDINTTPHTHLDHVGTALKDI